MKAAVIFMADNHPAPSGLKYLRIEAGLISFRRNSCTVFINYPLSQGAGAGIPLEMLPAHPKVGLAAILSPLFLHPWNFPSPPYYRLGRGKRTGMKSFISISKAFPKSRRHRTDDALTAPCQGQTGASISSPVPCRQSRGVPGDQQGEGKQFDQGALESGTRRGCSGGVFQL